MKEIEVYIELCREDIEIPTYARLGDAGMDIRAAEDIFIYPNETIVIPTGIKVAIPKGYEIQVRPRSGLSLKTPLRVSNSPGTVDSGFRDEVGVIMTNTSNTGVTSYFGTYGIDEKGNKQGAYQIKKGDRIAQLVLNEVPTIKFIQTDNVQSIGFNRGGGFGSSGVK